MFPDGEAARLLSQLQMPCAHCGGAFHGAVDDGGEASSARPARRAGGVPCARACRPDRGRGPGRPRAGSLGGGDCEPLREGRVERARAERLVRDLGLGVARRHNRSDDRVAIARGRRLRDRRQRARPARGSRSDGRGGRDSPAPSRRARRGRSARGRPDPPRFRTGCARRGTATPASRSSGSRSVARQLADVLLADPGLEQRVDERRARPRRVSPGRQSPTSSAFAPESTAAYPRRPASAASAS